MKSKWLWGVHSGEFYHLKKIFFFIFILKLILIFFLVENTTRLSLQNKHD